MPDLAAIAVFWVVFMCFLIAPLPIGVIVAFPVCIAALFLFGSGIAVRGNVHYTAGNGAADNTGFDVIDDSFRGIVLFAGKKPNGAAGHSKTQHSFRTL